MMAQQSLKDSPGNHREPGPTFHPKSHRPPNRRSQFNGLPTEILVGIFSAVQEFCSAEFPDQYAWETFGDIRLISRRCNSIVLQTPTLWASIPFVEVYPGGTNYEKMETWIERSQTCPLHLRINCSAEDGPLVDLLLRHVDRWKHVDFLSPYPQVAPIWAHPGTLPLLLAHMPEVQSFHMEGYIEREVHEERPPRISTPKLQWLECVGFGAQVIPRGLDVPLKHLQMGVQSEDELSNTLEMLRVAQNTTQTLFLIGDRWYTYNPTTQTPPLKAIECFRLTFLSLECCPWRLLECLITPVLEVIELGDCMGPVSKDWHPEVPNLRSINWQEGRLNDARINVNITVMERILTSARGLVDLCVYWSCRVGRPTTPEVDVLLKQDDIGNPLYCPSLKKVIVKNLTTEKTKSLVTLRHQLDWIQYSDLYDTAGKSISPEDAQMLALTREVQLAPVELE